MAAGGGAGALPGEGGGVRHRGPSTPRGPPARPSGGAGSAAARRPGTGTSAPRTTRRFPPRRLVGWPGWDGPCRPDGTLPLAGGGLGPRHRDGPQSGFWILARGAVWPHLCPRVWGGALAARRCLAWPGRPLGASSALCSLVWLLFSGTTVMVLPTDDQLPGPASESGPGRAVGRTVNGNVEPEDRTVNGALSVTRLSTVRSRIRTLYKEKDCEVKSFDLWQWIVFQCLPLCQVYPLMLSNGWLRSSQTTLPLHTRPRRLHAEIF